MDSNQKALKDLESILNYDHFIEHIEFKGIQRVYKIKSEHWMNKRSYSKDLCNYANKRSTWSIDPEIHMNILEIMYIYEASLCLDGLGGNKTLDKNWLKNKIKDLNLI